MVENQNTPKKKSQRIRDRTLVLSTVTVTVEPLEFTPPGRGGYAHANRKLYTGVRKRRDLGPKLI